MGRPAKIDPANYGATLDTVKALVLHVTVAAAPRATIPVDDVYRQANDTAATEAMVAGYIASVASRVTGRLLRASVLPEGAPFWEYLSAAAGDAVSNGAASYLVAAVTPEAATSAESQSYAAVLWARFVDWLDELDKVLDEALKDPDSGGVAAGGRVSGLFPEPVFTDEARF